MTMPLSIAPVPHDSTAAGLPDAATLALRAVHRAASELRRGTPVLLRGRPCARPRRGGVGGRLRPRRARRPGQGPGGAAAGAEPGRRGGAAAGPAPGPGGPVPGAEEAPVALRLPPSLLDPALLRSLADPTADRLPEGTRAERLPVPPLAAAALALAKLARLLPAVIAAPHALLARDGLLSVEAADVLAYPAAAATALRKVAEAQVPLDGAPDSRIVAFRAADGGIEHLAILVGQPEALAAGAAPRWPGSIRNASPATCSARCAATAARSCAGRSCAWARPAPAC
ncbi:hypothetical protein ACFQY5_15880 [Paeniroseomonas aquatica]|uniref:hypothetical protein n=1 Tax=Paeniroseomonas aquatica TaxID=373043 RepID=UPI00361AD62D